MYKRTFHDIYLFAFLLCMFFILPNLLEGNGRIEKYTILNDENHLINYGFFPEYPAVGPLHIAASIQNFSNMEYINAEVLININGPDFSEINSAKKSLNSPLFYEYDTVLKNTGIHEIKITIDRNARHTSKLTLYKSNTIEHIKDMEMEIFVYHDARLAEVRRFNGKRHKGVSFRLK